MNAELEQILAKDYTKLFELFIDAINVDPSKPGAKDYSKLMHDEVKNLFSGAVRIYWNEWQLSPSYGLYICKDAWEGVIIEITVKQSTKTIYPKKKEHKR